MGTHCTCDRCRFLPTCGIDLLHVENVTVLSSWILILKIPEQLSGLFVLLRPLALDGQAPLPPHNGSKRSQYIFVRNVSKMSSTISKNIIFSPKK